MRLKKQKEQEEKKSTVLPFESADLEEDLKAWKSFGLPAYADMALSSDRMPEAYREALERHYVSGEAPKEIGSHTLSRARKRLSEVIPSFEKDSDRLVFSEHSLERLMEENEEGNCEWSYLEPRATELVPTVPLGPVSRFVPFYRGVSQERYKQTLLGPGAIAQDLEGFDVEPDLYLWANGGKPSAKLLGALEGLSEDDRTLLHIRYDNSRDHRSKREYHEQSVKALNRLRSSLRVQEGEGCLVPA